MTNIINLLIYIPYQSFICIVKRIIGIVLGMA